MNNTDIIISVQDIFSSLNELYNIYKNDPIEKNQQALLNRLNKEIADIYSEVTAIYSLEWRSNQFGPFLFYQKQQKQIRHIRMQKMLIKLTTFLYNLRSWLVGEDIVLRLGGKVIEQKQLAKVDVPQNEWLKTISVNLSSQSIQLSYAIKDLVDQEQQSNESSGLFELWSQIKNLGSYTNVYDKTKATLDKFYQKQQPDTGVYVKFSTDKNNVRYVTAYYLKQFEYNLGWLYEWFMDWYEKTDINISNALSYFNDSKIKHPLALLFYNHVKDQNQSLLGGDVGIFQIKYNNSKLLSIHQLLFYIQSIYDTLKICQSKTLDFNQTVEKLKQLFINKNYNQINIDIQNKELKKVLTPLKKFAIT